MTGTRGSDRASIAAAIIAALAFGFSVYTLYYQQLRGARLIATTGNVINIMGTRRIGIPVTFFNDGARAAVINSGGLTLTDGSKTFHFKFESVASALAGFTLGGTAQKGSVPSESFLSPIAIRGGDTVEKVCWYYPVVTPFKYQAGVTYNGILTFSRRTFDQSESLSYSPLTTVDLAATHVVFRLGPLTISNAEQNPDVRIPVYIDDTVNP